MISREFLKHLGLSWTRRLIWLSLLASIYAILYLTFFRNEKYAVFVSFFERSPPQINVINQPPGIGLETKKVLLEIKDRGTGLDEIIVRADQDGEIRELYKHYYVTAKFRDIIEIPISARELDLTEGNLDLIVSVFDKAFWSNGVKQEILLRVNYQRPRVSVLSTQHNAVIGGSELCFYRLSNNEGGISGVRVGLREFVGFPARLLDASFEMTPDVYFSYFALPLGFDRNRDAVRIFARNVEGNESTAEFYYKALPTKGVLRIREVDDQFLSGHVEKLFDQMAPALNSEKIAKRGPLDKFRAILSQARALDEVEISKALSTREQKSTWLGGFNHPLSASLRVDFGDRREYQYQASEVGTLIYSGSEYATNLGQPVIVAAPGKVKFVGKLTLYGNTVIVDHGLGLSSLYGYLGQVSLKIGDLLEAGDRVGVTGTSGIWDSPGLMFEMRVNGVPVRAVEWFDRRWVQDHILNKIRDQKKLLGLLNNEVSNTDESTSE